LLSFKIQKDKNLYYIYYIVFLEVFACYIVDVIKKSKYNLFFLNKISIVCNNKEVHKYIQII